jgi:four helix bundle protein
MRLELEERLIGLSITINNLCEDLDNDFSNYYLTKQITRSSSSAALNYGEVQASESPNDFVHKISIVLKELKETKIGLKLILRSLKKDIDRLKAQNSLDECDQLVAIFYTTLKTAKKNLGSKKM